MSAACDVSLLVCTYNRAEDLRELIASATAQTAPEIRFELVVVNNNSSDRTEEVVRSAQQSCSLPIVYSVEKRQGKAFALNTALLAAQGTICAIADDDLILPPNYVKRLWSIFRDHPEISLAGGKVLPQWSGSPPAWLTEDHWSPLALTNYGAEPISAGSDRPLCLLAAAFRRQDILAVGEYNVRIGVSKGVLGGVEDHEIYMRMYAAGYRGRYEPSLHLFHKVEPERMEKPYHRRWHFWHGRQRARLMDDPGRRFMGVPWYVYRMALAETVRWFGQALRGRPARFVPETKLCFLAGIWWEMQRPEQRGT